jgi:hypothetical protein
VAEPNLFGCRVNKNAGVKKDANGDPWLPFETATQNHLQTVHAIPLFTLAEAASGEALKNSFPELVGKVIPVLRNSQMRSLLSH